MAYSYLNWDVIYREQIAETTLASDAVDSMEVMCSTPPVHVLFFISFLSFVPGARFLKRQAANISLV